ncbi:ABC transporter ATP-binding protein/permease [Pendulispora rubella]|uniref:ABC transporter ATP-binding protein/permease n=1 Tax=Pendulispora rubella TaxID=2741070 RepID=A0ABZ2L4M5_9BACT
MTVPRLPYGRLGLVILKRPGRVLLFLVAAFMHAIGHASVALSAGVLARALLGGEIPEGGGSSGHVFAALRGCTAWVSTDPAVVAAVVGLGAMLLKVAGQSGAAYLQAQLAGEVGIWVRQRVLDAWLSDHRWRAVRQPDHGGKDGTDASDVGTRGPWAQHVAALTERVHDLERGLEIGLLGGVRAIAQLVPLALVLVAISPRLAAASAFVFAPFGALLGYVRKKYKRGLQTRAAQGESLLEAADEAVRHADLWATYGAVPKVQAHMARLGREMTRHAARMEVSAAALSGSNEVLGALALVLALFAARAGWLGEGAGGATLLPFAIAFFLAYRPLRELTDARLALVRARVAISTLPVTLALPVPETRSGTGTGTGDLEIEGLLLGRGRAGAISFRAEAGQIVVVLGRTGVGKSTLLRTLLGLERAMGGRVMYGGADVTEAAIGPGARPFAWVPQDSPLLLDTLEANVCVASDADAAESCLDALGAHHLVTQLGTRRLGSDERPVSGGERQWIGLARAMATKAPVLLLDEPTNGLDRDAQARVLDAIARLRGKRTVILVTHRTEPTAIADAIVRVGDAPSEAQGDGAVSTRNVGPAATSTHGARSTSPSNT